jgi:aminoglycoside phosphotransferase (APT) family kinase protein
VDEDLRAGIERRLAALGCAEPAVTELTLLTGGASRQMWRVRTADRGAWSVFVLLRDHPSDPDPAGNEREAAVLTAAHAAGVLCPAVLDSSADPAVLGTPFLMLAFVEGETIARRILRDDRFAAARALLPAQLGEAAARIAGVEPDGLGLAGLDDPIGTLLTDYGRLGLQRPTLLLGLRELQRSTPPPAPRRTLVHGDFRLGNLMVDEGGLVAVLDWEMAHTGDPFEDLGYLCMRAWRFGGAGRVAGMGDVEELLDAYEAAGGPRPTAEQLLWWEARATAWWGVGCLRQMQRSVPGHDNELELLAIGRRAAEQEYDLLDLLYPSVAPLPVGEREGIPTQVPVPEAGSAPGLFSQPSADRLLAGLESYLAADLVAGEGAPNRFKARVAKNVVALLRRERRLGPAAERWYAAQLHALGVSGEEGLAERIRALPDTAAENAEVRRIVAVLKTASRLRLAVSNPGYGPDIC